VDLVNVSRVDRRLTPRHHNPMAGVILLERDPIVKCTVRDLSAAGAGLSLPDAVTVADEFDLAFERGTRHCVSWRVVPLRPQFSESLVTIVFNSAQTRVNRKGTTRSWCAFEFNVAGTVARRSGG
jgi:PilZ domain